MEIYKTKKINKVNTF